MFSADDRTHVVAIHDTACRVADIAATVETLSELPDMGDELNECIRLLRIAIQDISSVKKVLTYNVDAACALYSAKYPVHAHAVSKVALDTLAAPERELLQKRRDDMMARAEKRNVLKSKHPPRNGFGSASAESANVRTRDTIVFNGGASVNMSGPHSGTIYDELVESVLERIDDKHTTDPMRTKTVPKPKRPTPRGWKQKHVDSTSVDETVRARDIVNDKKYDAAIRMNKAAQKQRDIAIQTAVNIFKNPSTPIPYPSTCTLSSSNSPERRGTIVSVPAVPEPYYPELDPVYEPDEGVVSCCVEAVAVEEVKEAVIEVIEEEVMEVTEAVIEVIEEEVKEVKEISALKKKATTRPRKSKKNPPVILPPTSVLVRLLAPDKLSSATVNQLRALCKYIGIRKYSGKRKHELEAMLADFLKKTVS